jgi:hypothetical protein
MLFRGWKVTVTGLEGGLQINKWAWRAVANVLATLESMGNSRISRYLKIAAGLTDNMHVVMMCTV